MIIILIRDIWDNVDSKMMQIKRVYANWHPKDVHTENDNTIKFTGK